MKRSDAADFFVDVPAGHDTGMPDDKVRAVLEEIKEMGFTIEVRGGIVHSSGPGGEFKWPKFKCDHCLAQATRLIEEVFRGSYN